MRTAQQLYETVVNHLRKQKVKSAIIISRENATDTVYACRYRDPDGCKCAIGCLIPDAEYRSEMEGQLLDDLINGNLLPLSLSAEFYKNRRLLHLLQFIHDQKPIAEWEKQWRMVADDFKLKYPKL